jgi:hypothetical protein
LVSLRISISSFLTGVVLGASNQYSVDFEAANFPPDGLVGLAFESLSVFGDPPLFTTLVNQGTVAPVFGVKLAETGSELFLGGVNKALFTGSFKNVSLIEEVIESAASWNCSTDCYFIYFLARIYIRTSTLSASKLLTSTAKRSLLSVAVYYLPSSTQVCHPNLAQNTE